MTLAALTKPWAATSYGFLDASAKRELTPLAPQDEVEIVAPRQGG